MLHELLLQPFSLQFELKEDISYIKIINSNLRENKKRRVTYSEVFFRNSICFYHNILANVVSI